VSKNIKQDKGTVTINESGAFFVVAAAQAANASGSRGATVAPFFFGQRWGLIPRSGSAVGERPRVGQGFLRSSLIIFNPQPVDPDG
jgi:hypothetical protein